LKGLVGMGRTMGYVDVGWVEEGCSEDCGAF